LFWTFMYVLFSSFLIVFCAYALYANLKHLRYLVEREFFDEIADPDSSAEKVIVQGPLRFYGPFVLALVVGLFFLVPVLGGAGTEFASSAGQQICMPALYITMIVVMWGWFLAEIGETYVLTDESITRISTFMRERTIAWKDVKRFTYRAVEGAFAISDGKSEFTIEGSMRNIWVLPGFAFGSIPRETWSGDVERRLRRLAKKRRWLF